MSAPSKKNNKKSKLKQRASQYIPSVRFMVEDEYRDKLSPKDKEFLDKFNEATAGSNPQLLYRDNKTKRELWRSNQKIRRDAMAGALHGVQVEPISGSPEDAIIELLDRHNEAQEETIDTAAAEARKERIAARATARRAREKQEEATKKSERKKHLVLLRRRRRQESKPDAA